jgi:glutathione S-transferase
MFAALNTIEGRVQRLAEIDLFHAEQPWVIERRPVVVDAVQMRLAQLAVSCTEGWRAW